MKWRSNVYITEHAKSRASERYIKKLSPSRLGMHIQGALRAGVPVNEYGAIEVELGDGFAAICKPEMRGGWAVITIVDKEGWTA